MMARTMSMSTLQHTRNTQKITEELEKKYKFKLKETRPLKFLLGCDYFHEDDVLHGALKKYIEKMEASYEHFFSKKASRKLSSPLEKGDNPGLDFELNQDVGIWTG